jgi:hypothetical protein
MSFGSALALAPAEDADEPAAIIQPTRPGRATPVRLTVEWIGSTDRPLDPHKLPDRACCMRP